MTKPTSRTQPPGTMAAVSHVADFCRRYAGERVVFLSRVTIGDNVSDLLLRVSLPPQAQIEDYRGPQGHEEWFPSVELVNASYTLWWRFDGAMTPGSRYEFAVGVLLPHVPREAFLESEAALLDADGKVLGCETTSVAVAAKGRYLSYLPELYEEDGMMGRFLMLFESFWGPIETQIDNVHSTFDPRIAPASLLPWLAAWVDMTLDERLPEETRRQLIQRAVPLYRRRGTRAGLQQYMEIYTGGEVEIIEYRAENFRLGPEAHLGPGIALGQQNVPHTFTVIVRLPDGALSGVPEGREAARTDAERRRIQAVIDAEKPAHTTYDLHIEFATHQR